MLDNSYKIFIDSKFEKSLRGLPKNVIDVFNEKMEYFRHNPSHPSLNTKQCSVSKSKLKELGVDQVYEFYINRKDYRCLFYVTNETKEIIIACIANHTQVRNKLK